MRIEVDYDKCSGLGMCEAEAADVFEVDDDGNLNLLIEQPSESQRAEVEAAVAACPTEALRLVED